MIDMNFAKFMEQQLEPTQQQRDEVEDIVLKTILPNLDKEDALNTTIDSLDVNHVKRALQDQLGGMWRNFSFQHQQQIINFLEGGRGNVSELIDLMSTPPDIESPQIPEPPTNLNVPHSFKPGE